jgi:hypothetical protein
MSGYDSRYAPAGDHEPSRKSNNARGSIAGVSYSDPFVAQYSSYPGYTSTAAGITQGPQPTRAPPSTGNYSYSQLPHGLKYSAKPVIPVSKLDDQFLPSTISKNKYEDVSKYRSKDPVSEDDDYPTPRAKPYDAGDKYRSSDRGLDEKKTAPKYKGYDDHDSYLSKRPDSDDDKYKPKPKDYGDKNSYLSRSEDSDDDRRYTKKPEPKSVELDRYRSKDSESEDDKRFSKKPEPKGIGLDRYRSRDSESEEDSRFSKKVESKYADDRYKHDDFDPRDDRKPPILKDPRYGDLDKVRSRSPDDDDRGYSKQKDKSYGTEGRYRSRDSDEEMDPRYPPYDGRHPDLSKYPPPPPPPGNAPYPSGRDGFMPNMPPPPPPPAPYRDADPRSRPTAEAPSSNMSYRNGSKFAEVVPRKYSPDEKSDPRSSRQSLSSRQDPRSNSPDELRPKMDRLSIGGNRLSVGGGGGAGRLSVGGAGGRLSVGGDKPDQKGGMPPPSPLLESYRGTWQSMPGISSPMTHGKDFDDDEDLDDLEPLEPRSARQSTASFELDSRKSSQASVSLYKKAGIRRDSSDSSDERSPRRKDSGKSSKKSVSMYAADQDAKDIARQLLSRNEADFSVLTEILPHLSHDQILELHIAYKRVAKINGKGINLSKHIKLKAKGQYGTIAYVTALGRWDSESYWANYWYQSSNSKRELLIESLMGRPNHDIHMIKEGFRDKRYGDDLERCMEKELRADKFRSAVLMALDEKRQEENDVWPRSEVEKDVDVWAKSIRRGGGESAMLEICIQRSDRHLRECLRLYEKREGGNFAKLILDRSQNLVVGLSQVTTQS